MARRKNHRQYCCCCIPLRIGALFGGLLLAAFGGAGAYAFFAQRDLPDRTVDVVGNPIKPFETGKALWYYFAAVSVLTAATGLFGICSALLASRPMVKAFEAFYVLALLTHVALIAWSLIWFRQRQSDFDMYCEYQRSAIWMPSFTNDWTCAGLYRAIAITIGVGGLIWFIFNFYLSNRVIQYARQLFEERSSRNYKVLGEAASREMDREQQIPLAITGAPGTNTNDDTTRGDAFHHQPSYRDEIEYKNPRTSDVNAPFGEGYTQETYNNNHGVAAFNNYRASQQALDLVNPYHQDGGYGMQQYQQNEYIPQPPAATTVVPGQSPVPTYSEPNSSAVAVGASSSAGGQSFVHSKTNYIPSPFDEDDYSTPPPPVSGEPSSSADAKNQHIGDGSHNDDDLVRSPVMTAARSIAASATSAEPTEHQPPKAW